MCTGRAHSAPVNSLWPVCPFKRSLACSRVLSMGNPIFNPRLAAVFLVACSHTILPFQVKTAAVVTGQRPRTRPAASVEFAFGPFFFPTAVAFLATEPYAQFV